MQTIITCENSHYNARAVLGRFQTYECRKQTCKLHSPEVYSLVVADNYVPCTVEVVMVINGMGGALELPKCAIQVASTV